MRLRRPCGTFVRTDDKHFYVAFTKSPESHESRWLSVDSLNACKPKATESRRVSAVFSHTFTSCGFIVRGYF